MQKIGSVISRQSPITVRNRGGLAGLEAEDGEADREDLDRDQVKKEVRHGVGGEGQGGDGLVPEGVPPGRLVDPEDEDRDADQDHEGCHGPPDQVRSHLRPTS
jgi:hypothetical protein